MFYSILAVLGLMKLFKKSIYHAPWCFFLNIFKFRLQYFCKDKNSLYNKNSNLLPVTWFFKNYQSLGFEMVIPYRRMKTGVTFFTNDT